MKRLRVALRVMLFGWPERPWPAGYDLLPVSPSREWRWVLRRQIERPYWAVQRFRYVMRTGLHCAEGPA